MEEAEAKVRGQVDDALQEAAQLQARNAAVGADDDGRPPWPYKDGGSDAETHAESGARVFGDEDPAASARVSANGGGPPPARPSMERGVDACTQAETGPAEWTSHDMRRALRLLHSVDAGVVKRTLRRLHIRLWHAPAARMIELLRLAGAPSSAIKQVKEIVDTCRICRLWWRPTPKSMTNVRLAKSFNHVIQWDILFHRRVMISHCIDEAIRWSAGSILPDRHATSLIRAITNDRIRHHDVPELIIADGEKGLVSEEVAQWLDRHRCQLKPKAPKEHAQMVERHHELLRRILLRVEAQLAEEGIHVPLDVILAECFLAKNCLLKVAGHTPYRALYGRDPPGLAEFEPTSETQLDDASGGVAGHSRHIASDNLPLRPWSRKRRNCESGVHSALRLESQPNSLSLSLIHI